jgi:hypothetical protein
LRKREPVIRRVAGGDTLLDVGLAALSRHRALGLRSYFMVLSAGSNSPGIARNLRRMTRKVHRLTGEEKTENMLHTIT